ncbi:MAG: hypothetical protein QOD57_3224 [Actinomycetota bacterium]|nr:hypothetical protein [Actinomycetota bacterium]
MSEYHINVFWSAEDDAWLESARAHGDPIRPPRYRPAIYAAG